jgi:hypothetical protein
MGGSSSQPIMPAMNKLQNRSTIPVQMEAKGAMTSFEEKLVQASKTISKVGQNNKPIDGLLDG